MKRGVLVAIAGLAAAGVAAWALPRLADRRYNGRLAAPPLPIDERTRRLHGTLEIADLHADTLLWSRDPLRRSRRGHVDLPRLLEGNVALQVFSAVTQAPRGPDVGRAQSAADRLVPLAILQGWPPRTWRSPFERALWQAGRLDDIAGRAGGALRPVRTRGDLTALLDRRRRGERVVGALLALEGLQCLEGDPGRVEALWDAGYRMAGLVHLSDNDLAGSLHGIERGGLTALGREVLQRLESRGFVVDLAHASERTFDEVLALVARPPVVSHTGVRGTCDAPRNLSDAQLRAVAARGGLIGIGYWSAAVCDPSPAGVARAVRHAVEVAGLGHVALGSDFDGAVSTALDASELVRITQALADLGFTDAEIHAVAGGNALRFLALHLPDR